MFRILLWSILITASILSGTASYAAMKANEVTIPDKVIFNLKEGLRYHASPEYAKALELAMSEARQICKKHLGNPASAIVVDIDETLLDHTKEYERNHMNPKTGASTFNRKVFYKYMSKGNAPEIKAVSNFVRWARKNKFTIFLVTGRHEMFRKATIKNLAIHKIPYDDLFLETNMIEPYRAEDYKTACRRKIEQRGYRIICNIGDQWADLYGLHCDYCVKLPNKMYFTE